MSRLYFRKTIKCHDGSTFTPDPDCKHPKCDLVDSFPDAATILCNRCGSTAKRPKNHHPKKET